MEKLKIWILVSLISIVLGANLGFVIAYLLISPQIQNLQNQMDSLKSTLNSLNSTFQNMQGFRFIKQEFTVNFSRGSTVNQSFAIEDVPSGCSFRRISFHISPYLIWDGRIDLYMNGIGDIFSWEGTFSWQRSQIVDRSLIVDIDYSYTLRIYVSDVYWPPTGRGSFKVVIFQELY